MINLITFCVLGIVICSVGAESTVNSSLDLVLSKMLDDAPGPNVHVQMVLLTFAPGDDGTGPHTHPGPVVGYVIEGDFLQQLNDDPPQIFKKGDAFYEKAGAKHVWGGNASNTTVCKVLAILYGRPGEDLLTMIDHPRISREEALRLAGYY